MRGTNHTHLGHTSHLSPSGAAPARRRRALHGCWSTQCASRSQIPRTSFEAQARAARSSAAALSLHILAPRESCMSAHTLRRSYISGCTQQLVALRSNRSVKSSVACHRPLRHCPHHCRLPLLSHTQRRFDSVLTQSAARAAVAAHLALAALVLAHLLRALAARPLPRRILAGTWHAAVHAGVTLEDAARERAAHDARRLLLDTHRGRQRRRCDSVKVVCAITLRRVRR